MRAKQLKWFFLTFKLSGYYKGKFYIVAMCFVETQMVAFFKFSPHGSIKLCTWVFHSHNHQKNLCISVNSIFFFDLITFNYSSSLLLIVFLSHSSHHFYCLLVLYLLMASSISLSRSLSLSFILIRLLLPSLNSPHFLLLKHGPNPYINKQLLVKTSTANNIQLFLISLTKPYVCYTIHWY